MMYCSIIKFESNNELSSTAKSCLFINYAGYKQYDFYNLPCDNTYFMLHKDVSILYMLYEWLGHCYNIRGEIIGAERHLTFKHVFTMFYT